MWRDVFVAVVVEIGKLLAAGLRVNLEIIVRAVGDPFELVEAPRIAVLDVSRAS